jgi:pyruvate/2-oxoglutarate dehydrogenase complex dihydrolipoamide acyltransferase (E2) component
VIYRFALPDLGEGVAEGEILRWLVGTGQQVAEDDPLLEVETDKAGVEIPSPVAGSVLAVHGEPGDVVAVGTVLVEIDVPDAPAAAEPRATPGVRRLARELGVDLAAVKGTGPGGRITEDDVRGGTSPAQPSTRRTIARRLTEAAAVPTVTNVDACDFEAVQAAGVSPLVAVARACVLALADHPALNAWNPGGPQDAVHLGITTQTDRGLVVPVVRDAHTLDLDALATAITDRTTAARDGHATPADLRGSTFTITSAGRQAGLFATPLLNLPEVAILGLYRIEPRPAVRDDEIVVRHKANLSITFDHRALDGLHAAAFLAHVIELLEDWP